MLQLLEHKPPMVMGLTSSILGEVRAPEIGMVIWQRLFNRRRLFAAAPLLMRPPFTWEAEGTPGIAARGLFQEMPILHWALYADVKTLAERFAETTGSPVIKLRLEHVTDDSCRKFHVDHVGMRLLCTYIGPATEWIDITGKVRRMSPMDVGLFKGAKFSAPGPRIRHRSPPLSHLPPDRRSRLVLCIDQG